jgi:hypothetical protein
MAKLMLVLSLSIDIIVDNAGISIGHLSSLIKPSRKFRRPHPCEAPPGVLS